MAVWCQGGAETPEAVVHTSDALQGSTPAGSRPAGVAGEGEADAATLDWTGGGVSGELPTGGGGEQWEDGARGNTGAAESVHDQSGQAVGDDVCGCVTRARSE